MHLYMELCVLRFLCVHFPLRILRIIGGFFGWPEELVKIHPGIRIYEAGSTLMKHLDGASWDMGHPKVFITETSLFQLTFGGYVSVRSAQHLLNLLFNSCSEFEKLLPLHWSDHGFGDLNPGGW